MRPDLFSSVLPARGISPVVATDDTPLVSEIIDCADCDEVLFLLASGTIADTNATAALLIEEGDNFALSDNGAVADDYLIGTESGADFIFSDDNEVHKISYRCHGKRYVRATLTPSSNTGNLPFTVIALKGRLRSLPQTSQEV